VRAVIVRPPPCGETSPTLDIGEVPNPVHGPFDVVIRPVLTGLCGSDYALCAAADGGGSFHGPRRLPVIPGHETSGFVVSVGSLVSRVRPGALVALESVLPCGTCDLCLAGYRNECERVELLGLTRNGSLAELLVVPESACHDLQPLRDAGLTTEAVLAAGAVIEVFGCVFKALVVDAQRSLFGSTVVVHGLGPIGVAAVLLARLGGAARVIGIDPLPHRREFARQRADADGAFAPSAIDAIRAAVGGAGADLQIDASDDSTGVEIAETLAAARGEIVVMSRARERMNVDAGALISRAIILRGSRGQAGHQIYGRLIRLIAAGRLDAAKIVSQTLGMAQVVSWLQHHRHTAAGKVLVRTEP